MTEGRKAGTEDKAYGSLTEAQARVTVLAPRASHMHMRGGRTEE